jgi:hypothetical protein
MNVCNCSSASQTYQNTVHQGFLQRMQDFKGLANALQSGDLTSAQSAFDTLQTDLQNAPASSKTSALLDQTTTVGKDLKAVQDALQSGDLKAAQDAFTTLKQDLRGAHRAHGHHHGHRVGNDSNADDGTSATTTTAPDSSSTTSTTDTTETTPTLDVTA